MNTLHILLDQRLPPETRNQLTNHLPMALHALHDLGASPQRLQAYAAHYLNRFESLALPPTAAPAQDWRALRGSGAGYPALLAYFEQVLLQQGRDAVLRAALPDLLPGVAAAAFHGVIRAAHAIESGHDGELAQALGYWAWRWQPLAPPPDSPAMDFDAWTAALVEQAPGWTHGGPLISIRMEAATASAPYRALAGRLRWDDGLLQRLSAFAARRYLETRSFTVLHMVTGLRALRVVAPWVDDLPALAPGLLQAVTAAYLAAKIPAGTALPPPPQRPWDEVIALAIAQDDDHVIKLVHACRDHERAFGQGPWLQAACRAVA